jgi:hypothetical protein
MLVASSSRTGHREFGHSCYSVGQNLVQPASPVHHDHHTSSVWMDPTSTEDRAPFFSSWKLFTMTLCCNTTPLISFLVNICELLRCFHRWCLWHQSCTENWKSTATEMTLSAHSELIIPWSSWSTFTPSLLESWLHEHPSLRSGHRYNVFLTRSWLSVL